MTPIQEVVEEILTTNFIPVCDIPFFSEIEEMYRVRTEKGIDMRRLRNIGAPILGKAPDKLTSDDLRVVEVIIWGLEVEGSNGRRYHIFYHEDVGENFYKIGCTCKGYIFRNTCKHIKKIMEDEGLPECKYF